ncbi:MAG: hypothetical protein ABEJ35_03935 [Halobacteriaceae archaeon]
MSASDAPSTADGPGPAADDDRVMAALDEDDLVIADVSREDAWLVVPATEAPALADWR